MHFSFIFLSFLLDNVKSSGTVGNLRDKIRVFGKRGKVVSYLWRVYYYCYENHEQNINGSNVMNYFTGDK